MNCKKQILRIAAAGLLFGAAPIFRAEATTFQGKKEEFRQLIGVAPVFRAEAETFQRKKEEKFRQLIGGAAPTFRAAAMTTGETEGYIKMLSVESTAEDLQDQVYQIRKNQSAGFVVSCQCFFNQKSKFHSLAIEVKGYGFTMKDAETNALKTCGALVSPPGMTEGIEIYFSRQMAEYADFFSGIELNCRRIE